MNHKKLKIYTTISYGTLALMFGAMIVIGFWLFYPYKPVEFKSKFTVTTPVVKQGENMIYRFSYCKNSNVDPDVRREYVNGIVFRSSNARANVRTGCGTVTQREPIPYELPPGEYHFRVTIAYQVNPFRKITYIQDTNNFKVIAGEQPQ